MWSVWHLSFLIAVGLVCSTMLTEVVPLGGGRCSILFVFSYNLFCGDGSWFGAVLFGELLGFSLIKQYILKFFIDIFHMLTSEHVAFLSVTFLQNLNLLKPFIPNTQIACMDLYCIPLQAIMTFSVPYLISHWILSSPCSVCNLNQLLLFIGLEPKPFQRTGFHLYICGADNYWAVQKRGLSITSLKFLLLWPGNLLYFDGGVCNFRVIDAYNSR